MNKPSIGAGNLLTLSFGHGLIHQILQTLCMILSWSVYLFVFWPGTAMSDTFAQWNYFFSNTYVDGHPVLHTLLMKLIAGPSLSAASVAFMQIACLSLVAAWGFRVMRSYGVPLWLTWLVTVIFSFIPTNGVMTIFIVKDIPYTITFLAFSIFFAQMVITNGQWIRKPSSWILMGSVGALMALFRHNGLPTVLVTFLFAFFLFKTRRQIGLALVVFSILYFSVVGPLYYFMQVKHNNGLGDSIFLYHIAAHMKGGTEVTESEREYLDQLLPLKDWKYNRCTVDPIFWNEHFNKQLFEWNPRQNMRIFLETLIKNPMINIQHVWNTVNYVFNPFSTNCKYRQASMLYVRDGKINWTLNYGDLSWVHQDIRAALAPSSRLPSLVQPFYGYIDAGRRQPISKFLFWNNAFYLNLAFLVVLILAIKAKEWKYLMIFIPVLAQSAILVAAFVAAEFRYQYPVFVFSLFSLCLLGLPNCAIRES